MVEISQCDLAFAQADDALFVSYGNYYFLPSVYEYLLDDARRPKLCDDNDCYLIYTHAFEFYKFGLAAAESFVLGVVIIIASVLQFKLMASDVEF